jgi:hypothetical protein
MIRPWSRNAGRWRNGVDCPGVGVRCRPEGQLAAIIELLVRASLSIGFHGANEASVSTEATASGEDEQRAEILLFALYAAHWIDKLNRRHRGPGINPGVDLALTLRVSEEDDLMDLLVMSLEHEDPVLRLAPETKEGGKSFSAEVRYSDPGDPASIDFTTSSHGFGLLGRGLRGVGGYGGHTVLALRRHLLLQREQDEPYTIRLWWAGHELGQQVSKEWVPPVESGVGAAARGWDAVSRVGRTRRKAS